MESNLLKSNQKIHYLRIKSSERDISTYPSPNRFRLHLNTPFFNVKSINLRHIETLNEFTTLSITSAFFPIEYFDTGKEYLYTSPGYYNLDGLKNVFDLTGKNNKINIYREKRWNVKNVYLEKFSELNSDSNITSVSRLLELEVPNHSFSIGELVKINQSSLVFPAINGWNKILDIKGDRIVLRVSDFGNIAERIKVDYEYISLTRSFYISFQGPNNQSRLESINFDKYTFLNESYPTTSSGQKNRFVISKTGDIFYHSYQAVNGSNFYAYMYRDFENTKNIISGIETIADTNYTNGRYIHFTRDNRYFIFRQDFDGFIWDGKYQIFGTDKVYRIDRDETEQVGSLVGATDIPSAITTGLPSLYSSYEAERIMYNNTKGLALFTLNQEEDYICPIICFQYDYSLLPSFITYLTYEERWTSIMNDIGNHVVSFHFSLSHITSGIQPIMANIYDFNGSTLFKLDTIYSTFEGITMTDGIVPYSETTYSPDQCLAINEIGTRVFIPSAFSISIYERLGTTKYDYLGNIIYPNGISAIYHNKIELNREGTRALVHYRHITKAILYDCEYPPFRPILVLDQDFFEYNDIYNFKIDSLVYNYDEELIFVGNNSLIRMNLKKEFEKVNDTPILIETRPFRMHWNENSNLASLLQFETNGDSGNIYDSFHTNYSGVSSIKPFPFVVFDRQTYGFDDLKKLGVTYIDYLGISGEDFPSYTLIEVQRQSTITTCVRGFDMLSTHITNPNYLGVYIPELPLSLGTTIRIMEITGYKNLTSSYFDSSYTIQEIGSESVFYVNVGTTVSSSNFFHRTDEEWKSLLHSYYTGSITYGNDVMDAEKKASIVITLSPTYRMDVDILKMEDKDYIFRSFDVYGGRIIPAKRYSYSEPIYSSITCIFSKGIERASSFISAPDIQLNPNQNLFLGIDEFDNENEQSLILSSDISKRFSRLNLNSNYLDRSVDYLNNGIVLNERLLPEMNHLTLIRYDQDGNVYNGKEEYQAILEIAELEIRLDDSLKQTMTNIIDHTPLFQIYDITN